MALPNEMSRDASITKCPLKAAVAINFWTFLKITQAGEIVDKPVRFLKFYKNLKSLLLYSRRSYFKRPTEFFVSEISDTTAIIN